MQHEGSEHASERFREAVDENQIGLDDELCAYLKAELELGERLLWAARACPPPVPAIDAFPAFFTALLCGLSGFALAVVYGIYGLVEMTPREALLNFGLGPAAIGFFVLLAVLARRMLYFRTRWRLSRTFYGLTDRRTIVGLEHAADEPLQFTSLRFDRFYDTLCIEHQDGSGDVYFVGQEPAVDAEGQPTTYTGVIAPELGFVSVPRAVQVAELVRASLLGSRRPPCWNPGKDRELAAEVFWAGD